MSRARLTDWRLDWTPITLGGVQVADGSAVYLLAVPHPDPELRIYPLLQPFRRDEPLLHPSPRFHVWGWDGDRERPTLSPSYLARFCWGHLDGEQVVHLFLRAGRIELLGDSTVELALESR